MDRTCFLIHSASLCLLIRELTLLIIVLTERCVLIPVLYSFYCIWFFLLIICFSVFLSCFIRPYNLLDISVILLTLKNFCRTVLAVTLLKLALIMELCPFAFLMTCSFAESGLAVVVFRT